MRRQIVWWVGLVGTGVAVASATVRLNEAGFCFSQQRFLSNSEKVEAAADYARRGFSVRIVIPQENGAATEAFVWTPVYATAAEFMVANPGCCRTAGPGDPVDLGHPEWSDRQKRRPEQSVVVVDMAVPFTGPDGEGQTATFRTNIAVDPCGEAERKRFFKRVASLAGGVSLPW